MTEGSFVTWFDKVDCYGIVDNFDEFVVNGFKIDKANSSTLYYYQKGGKGKGELEKTYADDLENNQQTDESSFLASVDTSTKAEPEPNIAPNISPNKSSKPSKDKSLKTELDSETKSPI